MATATTKTKAATTMKTPAPAKGTPKATDWRFEPMYDGESVSGRPVTQTQMLGQLKKLTGAMAGMTNGSEITIKCSLAAAGKKSTPMH